MEFTQDEKSIISFYNITDRTALITELKFIIPHIADEELKETAESAVHKLEQMSDTEFDNISFSDGITEVTNE